MTPCSLADTTQCVPFLFWPLSPYGFRGRGFLVPLITLNNTHTHTHTHTVGTPSGGGIGLSLRHVPYNTQHSQQTDTHTRGGIRTRNSSKRSAASLHLRRRIHRDRTVCSSKRELPDFVEHIYVVSVYLTTVSVTQIIVNGRMNSE
jgi:hypothetical protein